MAGCSTKLPSREVPNELGVKQVQGVVEGHPAEFIFCDVQGGVWGCESSTPKTAIQTLPAADRPRSTITSAVKTVIGESAKKPKHVNESPKVPAAFDEQPIPDSSPLATVYFDFDSSVLGAKAKLALLDLLNDLGGKNVEVHGYTDSVGSEPYNNWLGKRRADKVKTFFETADSSASSVKAFGHGLCCYAEPNSTEEQRAKNRRVEVYVTD